MAMSMDIEKMRETGVTDYYLDLTKYKNEFINKNYPLTKEDMRDIVNDKTNDNIEMRKEISRVIESEIQRILTEQSKQNQQYIEALEKGETVPPFNIEIYKQQIFEYKQQILEAIYEYKVSKGILKTQVVSENESFIRGAINEGISGDAIESTLKDVIDKSDEMGKTPKQVKEVVETIVDMKQKENTKVDERYSSDFVKNNSEKIESALEEGITPDEIAKTLVENTNKANDRKSKKHLKFVTKLISKMKVKELKLRKSKENQMEKGMQKVLK